MQTEVAVIKEKVGQNKNDIQALFEKHGNQWEKQFKQQLAKETRSNNTKIAIIGAVAVVMPTILILVTNAVGR